MGRMPRMCLASLNFHGDIPPEVVQSDAHAACEAVLVEAVGRPGAAVAYAAGVLDFLKRLLGADAARGVEGMVVVVAALDCGGVGRVDGIESYEDVGVGGWVDVLQDVHVVG